MHEGGVLQAQRDEAVRTQKLRLKAEAVRLLVQEAAREEAATRHGVLAQMATREQGSKQRQSTLGGWCNLRRESTRTDTPDSLQERERPSPPCLH